MEPSKAYAEDLRTKGAKETTTICPYCGVGCSIVMYVKEGKIINTEGDPDSPINEGTLCPKGASVYQIVGTNNPYRIAEPVYRAPGATEWKKVSWDWALDRIAKLVKQTRDKYFIIKNSKGQLVTRVDAIAHIGLAALDNEECYLLQKIMRSWGLVYIEHQARICHSPSVPALAESFGRGAMTNHWIDFRNADLILNLGGNNLFFREYLINYTDVSFLVDPNFKGPEDLDGLLSGYDEKKSSYNKSTRKYQLDENGIPKRDLTVQDSNFVFRLLKKHYKRYTIETVSNITGAPKDKLEEAYKLIGSCSKPDRVCTVSYAMGWTPHTVGVQEY